MYNSPHSHRRSRAKDHLLWLDIEQSSEAYSRNFIEIARHYPTLSRQELRISALVKAELPSWKIGEMLYISEHAVEKHRSGIRQKMQLPHEINLQTFLVGL
jgi:DNA-binding CsgD family transcriptional regulator